MRTDQSRLRRPGIAAAAAALLVAGVVGGVGVAGATRTTRSFPSRTAASRASPTRARRRATPASAGNVTIQTGETVTWDCRSGARPQRRRRSHDTPPTPTWDGPRRSTFAGRRTSSTRSARPASTTSCCRAHADDEGHDHRRGRAGRDARPPTRRRPRRATPTATPTFAATRRRPRATAAPDDHLTTPAPGKGAAKDTEAPRLLRAQVKPRAGRREAAASGSPSPRRRGHGAARQVRRDERALHVAAGTRSVVVRSSSLRKKGTYTVQWRAVDAMANKGNVVKKTLKVKR